MRAVTLGSTWLVIVVLGASWLTSALGLSISALLSHWHLLGSLAAYERRRFLAERLSGFWYEHAFAVAPRKSESAA